MLTTETAHKFHVLVHNLVHVYRAKYHVLTFIVWTDLSIMLLYSALPKVPKGAVSSSNCTVKTKSRVVSQLTPEFISPEGSKLVSGVYILQDSQHQPQVGTSSVIL